MLKIEFGVTPGSFLVIFLYVSAAKEYITPAIVARVATRDDYSTRT